MPIHDQSYRRYRGSREAPGKAWVVIALAGMRAMLGRRPFLGLLLLAWFPFFARVIQIYVASNFPETSSLLAPTPQTFRDFLDQQGAFVFFIAIYAGAGLIASDRRANALQIYLSKPLTRVEYVAGKLASLMAFLLLVTWVPGLLLLLVQIMFAGTLSFARANAFLFPAITLFAFLQVIVASFAMLALSSLSKSSRFVGIMYAGAVFFTESIFNVLRVVTGGTTVSWVSFSANLAQVGDVMFRLRPRYEAPWLVSLIVLVALVVVSISVLERRIRGVEVVT